MNKKSKKELQIIISLSLLIIGMISSLIFNLVMPIMVSVILVGNEIIVWEIKEMYKLKSENKSIGLYFNSAGDLVRFCLCALGIFVVDVGFFFILFGYGKWDGGFIQ